MPKEKSELYKEAVERNLFGAKKYRQNKYSGLKLEVAKQKLGIRADDTMYDDEVAKLVAMKKVKAK